MTFRYEGHDKMGRPMKGELEAGSVEAASAALREQGVYAMNLEPATDAPMKTVLEHKDPIPDPRFVDPDGLHPAPDAGAVEAEVEKMVAEAEAEAKAVGDEGRVTGCRLPGLTELQSEVIRAMSLAREVRDVLRDQGCIEAYCEMMEQEALKEMIAEAAVRQLAKSSRRPRTIPCTGWA